jgi:hypothetical protein
VKRIFYLPSDYAKRKHLREEGVAESGEVSPQGTVVHEEDWEGRVAATARPSTLHLKRLPDGRVLPKTVRELVEEGKFVIGLGPAGVDSIRRSND